MITVRISARATWICAGCSGAVLRRRHNTKQRGRGDLQGCIGVREKKKEEVDSALLLFGRVLYISSAELEPALKLDSSSRVRAIEVIGPCAQCGLRGQSANK